MLNTKFMKFQKVYTLEEIANIINCEYVGDANFPVSGMNEIHVVESGDIVFVDHPKYYEKALNSAATIVLINKNVACPGCLPQRVKVIFGTWGFSKNFLRF